MKYLITLSFLFCYLTMYTQTQIGNDINGVAFNDRLGRAVSISADGKRIVLGSATYNFNSGHARIFEENSGIWTQVGSAIDSEGPGDLCGRSVAISGDGKRVAIGAIGNMNIGHARIFEESGGLWTQVGSDIDGDTISDKFGTAVSISLDGKRVAISAVDHDISKGHVKIYEENSGMWTQIGGDIDGEEFLDESGESVSISADGKRVAIGAMFNKGNNGQDPGHVRIYEENAGIWAQIGGDIDGEGANDLFGGSVSLSADGKRVAIAAEANDGNGVNSGHVRIYKEGNGNWTQIGNDIDGQAAFDYLGAVSLSLDGKVVAIGAPENDGTDYNAGNVRIFKEGNGAWTQVGMDIGGTLNEESGFRVSLSGDGSRVLLGAPHNDENGSLAGQVRVYGTALAIANDNFVQEPFSFNLTPNPTQNKFVLQIEMDQSRDIFVGIVNPLGETVVRQQVTAAAGLFTKEFDLSRFANGIYFIQLTIGEETVSRKLVYTN